MNKPIYVVGSIDVVDFTEYFDRYAVKLKVILDRYQAEVLSGTTRAEAMEGDKYGNWMVLIKFPSEDLYKECINSPEYKELSKVRQQLSRGGNIIMVPGV